MRLFLAIPLSPAFAAGLERTVAALRRPGDGLRWTSADSWHITLQFLGNASAEQYGCLLARLPEVHASPVSIRLESFGCFERSGVLIAAIAASPELASLVKRVQSATAVCGFLPEARPFQPHITLARARGRDRALRMLAAKLPAQPGLAAFEASEFLLYESHLGSSGARYEVRAWFPLAG